MRRKICDILRGEQGLSMILVLCIGALFVGLSAALVYAASVLTANANRQLLEQEAYQLATGFSDVLETQLNDSTSDFAKFVNGTYMISPAYGKNPFEEPSTPTTFTWQPDGTPAAEGADSIKITLSRRPGDDVEKLNVLKGVVGSSVTTDDAQWQTQLETWTDTEHPFTVTDMQLDVTVTVTKDGEDFAYTVTYDRQIHYPVASFKVDGKEGYTWERPNTFTKRGADPITINSDDHTTVHTIAPEFDTSQSTVTTDVVTKTIHYTRGSRKTTATKEN